MAEDVEVKVGVQVDGAKTLTNLKKDIKDAQGQAIALSRQFGETSKEAQAAAKRVAELRDEMNDLNERVSLADPGAKFQAFGNVVSGVTAGFTAAQGAMAVFGNESEDLQRQLVKLQGALNLTQGLSTIADSYKDFERLGATIGTKVVKAFGTLKSAIISTGIGALLVALGLIISNFDEIEKWLKKVIPGFEGFGAIIDNLKAAIMSFGTAALETIKQVGSIILNFFNGDFSGAIKAAGELGDKVGKAYKDAVEKNVQQISIDKFAKKRREEAEALENELTKIEAREGKKRYDLRLQLNSKIQDALTAEGKWDSKELAANLAERSNILRESTTEAGQKQLKALQDRQALEMQALTDAGKSTIGIREQQLQAQLALEKKYGLDTDATLQEILQARAADRKASFDKELQALQQSQALELQAAAISGKDILHLKEEQLQAQLDLYQKYGFSVQNIERQIAASMLEERSKLNQALSENTNQLVKKSQDGLINVGTAQQQLNTDTAKRNAKAAAAAEIAEQQKQRAISDTTYILQQSAQEGEQRSNIETAASAVLAISMQADELAKQDALQATGTVLKTATAILGQQTAIGKGVAIADATISTYQAAQSSFTALSPIPIVGPALGAIAAAAAIVAGVARVKKIVSTKVPGAGSQGGAALPAGTPAPPVPTVQASATTLLQQQLQQSQQSATRVYVLETDITDTQKRVASIEENAKF